MIQPIKKSVGKVNSLHSFLLEAEELSWVCEVYVNYLHNDDPIEIPRNSGQECLFNLTLEGTNLIADV